MLFDLIHSVDSVELAAEIQRYAEACKKTQRILLQVNTARDGSKHGVAPEKAEEFLAPMKPAAVPG